MHIEPGYIAPAKVLMANAAASGVLIYYAKDIVKTPVNIVKTGVAAIFFSLFMQSFHMSIGPSELHFIGASAIYLTLGFIPTLFGFALGLLLQGLLFEPGDLPHLAVNSLSLIVPLITMHYGIGRRFFDKENGLRLSWPQILKIDAVYYSGVTGMVGFWLLIGEVPTPLHDWAKFASSYIFLVALEPLVTFAVVTALKRYQDKRLVSSLFIVGQLRTS